MSRQEIEALDRQWQEAFNAGDAGGVARLYAEDGRVHPPNAEMVQGRAAIEGLWKEFVQMQAKVSFGGFAFHEAGDLVVDVGRYELELQPEGGEAQRDAGKYVAVWKRQPDGSWLMVDDIFNSSLPAS